MFWLRTATFTNICAFTLLSGAVFVVAAPGAPDEEAALFAELDELLRDPLAEAPPAAAELPDRVWQTAAGAGLRFGYTTNALLSGDALAMPYMTWRMDATVMAFMETSSVTLMVSGENRRFLGEIALDDERLALVLVRMETEAPLVDLGAEAGAIHAKQAFDAAVAPVPQVPDAGFVTQTLPFARAWVRHYPLSRTALEWSLRGDRAFFGESADDYASATARVRLSHSLASGVLLHLAGERTASRYERRSLRLANGFPVADSRLRLETWRGEAELEVRAGSRLPLRATVRAYIEDRNDTMRGYYARSSRGVDGRITARRGNWRATVHGLYEDSPFSTRLVSPVSVETVTQSRRSGTMSLERSLGRWRIAGSAQRTRFLSNAVFESYTVNQYELSADFYF
ncbi:MAG: hypothetical protein JJU00_09835 [Opitutales bacterium]|nr:hypothetical protein [Opitutales bacterium]